MGPSHGPGVVITGVVVTVAMGPSQGPSVVGGGGVVVTVTVGVVVTVVTIVVAHGVSGAGVVGASVSHGLTAAVVQTRRAKRTVRNIAQPSRNLRTKGKEARC